MSKLELARDLFSVNQTRGETIQIFVSKLGMKATTASTYQAKLKKESKTITVAPTETGMKKGPLQVASSGTGTDSLSIMWNKLTPAERSTWSTDIDRYSAEYINSTICFLN